MGDTLFRAGLCAISAGVAALVIGFGIELAWSPLGLSEAGLPTVGSVAAASMAMPVEHLGLRGDLESRPSAHPGLRLASLETGIDGAFDEDKPDAVPALRASFDERFASAFGKERVDEGRSMAFAEPVWRAVAPSGGGAPAQPETVSPRPRVRVASLTPSDSLGSGAAALGATSPAGAARPVPANPKPPSPASDGRTDQPPPPDPNRTAVYDIAAHVVYLPNGEKLEAHSGLGSRIDDARYVNIRGQGPTPPNVYELVLRKQLFHGVQAIRLIPVGDGNMFGRDGILAHSYMLGPNGQSNGCVSFDNYPAFLNAFLKGEVDHIVVVDHLSTTPSSTGLGWLPQALRNLFKPS